MSSAQIWIDRLKRNSIRNISHTKWTEKYANHAKNLAQAVLIISGRNRDIRTFYHIQILHCMYESFTGPHFVSINGNAPFWVHSLTAFRREFFNFTVKLSFERSVFMCLDNGEVIRLKIVRSYMEIPVFTPSPDQPISFCVYKTPASFFMFAGKDYLRHQRITEVKRAKAIEQNSAVRSRIRQHLFSSVEQLFSSYIRDTHVTSEHAYAWFLTDYHHALHNCSQLFYKMTRTQQMNAPFIENGEQANAQLQIQPFSITPPNPAPAVLTTEITNTLPTLLINSFTSLPNIYTITTPSSSIQETSNVASHLQPTFNLTGILTMDLLLPTTSNDEDHSDLT